MTLCWHQLSSFKTAGYKPALSLDKYVWMLNSSLLPSSTRAFSLTMSFLRTWLAWLSGRETVFVTSQRQSEVEIPLVVVLQAGNEVLQQTQSWAEEGVEIRNPSMFWLTKSLLSPSSHTRLWAFLWTRYKRFTTCMGVPLFALGCETGALPLSFGTPNQCSLSNHA